MRISIIGSGNVATHLGAAFKNAGHRMVQVYSRDVKNAALLAYHIGAEAIDDLGKINPDTPIAQSIAKYQKLTVHTAGSIALEALTSIIPTAGVFYPLQTFSKNKEVDFTAVPLCIEGASEAITKQLTELAQTISNNVYHVNSVQRKALHLAAVFACNFPNYLYGIASQLLAENDMEFAMLRPLILETAQKVQERLPADVQTGPAIRKDEHTIAAHMQMLNAHPELRELYNVLSQAIIKNK
jgi:predicted short-subunit dehydrogenase-like oxidoreductase (DUF2520 family)